MNSAERSVVCILLLGLEAFSQNVAINPVLRIDILEGEGAVNYLKSRTSREVIVQVTDENHKPVGGALVTFSLPTQGASGTFANGSQLVMTVTDGDGKAVAAGLRANSVKGTYNVQVRASSNGQTANATIAQMNIAAAVAGGVAGTAISVKILTLIAVAAAAGVAGGVVAATRGGSSEPVPVSVGTVTFGAPPRP